MPNLQKAVAGKSRFHLPGGEALLLDESYNANPASVAAALALLSTLKPGKNGRRIAVLGDMLELGAFAEDLHRGLAKDMERNGIDRVHAAGPLMKHLWDALPEAKRGAHADLSSNLLDDVMSDLRAGDCVMVKGSLGSRMGPIVEALKAKWPQRQIDENLKCCIICSPHSADDFSALQRVSISDDTHWRRNTDSTVVRFYFWTAHHILVESKAGSRPTHTHGWATAPHRGKARHTNHGWLDDLVRRVFCRLCCGQI